MVEYQLEVVFGLSRELRLKIMGAAFVGNHPSQPRVHRLRADELTLAAAGQQLAYCRMLRILGVQFRSKSTPCCRTALRLA